MDYTKEFKERDDLLNQLESRGLSIPDRSAALNFLTRVGYFRSGAYRYVFRQMLPPDEINEEHHQYRRDEYIPGANIEHVMKIENYDSKLGRVCLEGVLDFEIRLRAAIAHTLASKNIAAHLSENYLDKEICRQKSGNSTKFQAWIKTSEKAIRAATLDEDFIRHHRLKYPNDPVPTWAVTEVLSFGSLPYLFDLMQTQDAREVARMFGFTHPKPFGAVIRMMVDLRNTSAHGSRLFNRAFKRSLVIREHDTQGDLLAHIRGSEFSPTPKPNQRLYIYAATLAFMLQAHPSGSKWNLSFKTQVRKLDLNLIAPDGSPIISPEVNMGFPVGWIDHELWQ